MFHLNIRTYAAISAFIFSLVSLVHLVRLFEQGSIVLFGWNAPLWVSVVGLIVAGYLAFEGFRIVWPAGFQRHTKMPST